MRQPRSHVPAPVVAVVLIAFGTLLAIGLPGLIDARRRVPDSVPAVPVRLLEAAETPIAAEADVFRTRLSDLALSPSSERRRAAHPRTLTTARRLRAYPGAPPRVPHGLTASELRQTRCNTCHERGGFSPRFAAYVPVTPHPEWESCLQCHAADPVTAGVPLPATQERDPCRQCHEPGAARAPAPELNWRPADWPRLSGAPPGGVPPPVPHDKQMRGNCVACHAGPAAPAEIRTTHAERANCRQCHVEQVEGLEPFVRPASAQGSAR